MIRAVPAAAQPPGVFTRGCVDPLNTFAQARTTALSEQQRSKQQPSEQGPSEQQRCPNNSRANNSLAE